MHTKKFDFMCGEPGCQETFFNRRLLDCHIEEVHVRELKYTCHHCARMFYSRYRLGSGQLSLQPRDLNLITDAVASVW